MQTQMLNTRLKPLTFKHKLHVVIFAVVFLLQVIIQLKSRLRGRNAAQKTADPIN